MRRWLHWRVVIASLLGVACGAAAALWIAGAFRKTGAEPVARKDTGKAYVVVRVYWRYVDGSSPQLESEPAGAGFPLKVFADRAAAAAHCRELERAARAKCGCPFSFGRDGVPSLPSLDDYTTTPTGAFLDWLEDQGLEPPAGQRAAWEASRQRPASGDFQKDSWDAWVRWWVDNAGQWDADLRERVWDKLDRVRFFEVVEVESDG